MVAHASAQKIIETTNNKSLIIRYLSNTTRTHLRSYVDELKRRINSEWPVLSQAVITERAASNMLRLLHFTR